MRLFDTNNNDQDPVVVDVDFGNNNLEYENGVKNDGMSDQQPKQSLQAANRSSSTGVAAATGGGGNNGGERPGSARSNRERHERVIMLKERQNSERIKKLEELKEQAMAAARLREEQDSKRRKHFEDLGRKDDERRRQAEERRRMLDEERRLALQNKWETKRSAQMSNSFMGGKSKPSYAFGSCTPRLLDNHVDGFLWKSQYNLNVTKEPGMRASSAQDLHLQKEVRMSTSMYEWNQHRTTPDNPLVNNNTGPVSNRASHRRKNESAMDASRVFCGRRKTDLTPTIPIKRDDYTVMSRSTSRGSGRVYSSMTRLDRSRSPGGSLTQYQHHGSSNLHHSPQRPSRSKSTTHLQSAGLKLTRTEILRQALATKKEASGIRSVDASRPPSSMSSSIMTSSTHSQVQMRPRTSYVRKTRPASVHVTGVTSDHVSNDTTNVGTKDNTPLSSRRSETPSSVKSAVSRKPSNELRRPATSSSQATTSGKSSGKTSPSPMSQSMHETSTMKRPIKKKLSPTLSNSSIKEKETKQKAKTPEPAGQGEKTVDNNAPVEVEKVKAFTEMNENQQHVNNKPEKNIENFESIESAFASGSEDFTYSSKTPEPFAPSPGADSATNTVSEVLDKSGRESASTNVTIDEGNQDWSNPFISNVTPEPTANVQELKVDDNVVVKQASPVPPESKPEEDVDGGEAQKPKIMTEEQAKAAMAEKRRLAREAAEREAARIAELERQELERQRLEEEEAERLAMEARRLEEERLRKAIEEEQRRQEDEKKRKEEEEKARQEKERQERAAAKEAERIRLEMEERLRKEEAERLERKRRVEAIMSRTRKKEAEQQQQQAKSNNSNSNNSPSELVSQQNDLNGHKENIILQESIMQSSVNSLNNNFNNNNDFGSNVTNNDNLIDNNTVPSSSTGGASSSTLISFDGMSGSNAVAPPPAHESTGNNVLMDNAVDLLNFSQQQTDNASSSNLSPDLLGTGANPPLVNLAPNNISSGSPNNSIISNPLQEVFIIDLLS